MKYLTPKEGYIIQKQSAKIEQKNRMIKCLRSELQRSNEKMMTFEKKLEEYPKVDIRILKAVESMSSTEDHDVYSGIIMDQLRNFGKFKTSRWNQATLKHCIILHARIISSFEGYTFYICHVQVP